MYPHLYSPLDIKNVKDEFELNLNENGIHELPDNFKKYYRFSVNQTYSLKVSLKYPVANRYMKLVSTLSKLIKLGLKTT